MVIALLSLLVGEKVYWLLNDWLLWASDDATTQHDTCLLHDWYLKFYRKDEVSNPYFAKKKKIGWSYELNIAAHVYVNLSVTVSVVLSHDVHRLFNYGWSEVQ